MEITRTGNSFQLSELNLYVEDQNILCIHVLPNNCLLLGVTNNTEAKVLDLGNGVVTKTIPNASMDGRYHCFQSLIRNPNFVVVKDRKSLNLINTTTLTATKFCDIEYDTWSNFYSTV